MLRLTGAPAQPCSILIFGPSLVFFVELAEIFLMDAYSIDLVERNLSLEADPRSLLERNTACPAVKIAVLETEMDFGKVSIRRGNRPRR